MIAAMIGIGFLYGLQVAAELLLVREEIEAEKDTERNQTARRKTIMYWFDQIVGPANVIDLVLFGLFSNFWGGVSRKAEGSPWRLTRIVMWRGPDGPSPKALERHLIRHGVIVLWRRHDGDKFICHVRQTQTKWAKHLIKNMPASAWADSKPTQLDRLTRRLRSML